MTSKKLRLSICVVTYNHEKYIAQALDSFLMQKTDFAFQVIVGDDCSTDNTTNILREYAEKYPDIIKPIFRVKNIGPMNNSLDVYDHAKTEYVAICDGDDYWTDNNKLQKQVDFLDKNKDFSICFHLTKIIYENGLESSNYPSKEYRFNKDVLSLNDLALRNPMHTNSIVYRWRFVEENVKEMIPNDICPGDYFLALLHAEKGKIKFIEEVMSVYRKHATSLSNDLVYNDHIIWLKYGLLELNCFKAIDKHFQYSLSEYMRSKKIERCSQILNAFIQNNATEKLETFKRDYPEFYYLGLKYLNTNLKSENIMSYNNEHTVIRRKINKLKICIYSVMGLLIVNMILNLFIYIK